jgi:hypothetical protein
VFAARSRLALGLAAAVLLLGGCGDFDDAASAQGIAGNDLVSELAAQLTVSETLTYLAGYRLAGGATAKVAQDQNPSRAAYDYPGGRVLVSADAVTLCQGARKPTCTLTAAPEAGGTPSATVFAAAEQTGMVAPATVLALLNAAALSPDIIVKPRDTTIAGHHATCVDLNGVDDKRSRAFATCVTNDGVLGSFTGTLDGKPVDVAMTEFSPRVAAHDFAPPTGASTVDRRATS